MSVGASAVRQKSAEHTNVRVLELFFALFEAPHGLAHRQVHALESYRSQDEHAFDVMVKRDLLNLRSVGVRVEERVDSSQGTVSKRYFLDRASVQSIGVESVSAQQLQLIHLALALMPQVDDVELAALEHFLRARSDDFSPQLFSAVDSSLDEASSLSVIFDAIERRIPLSFWYTSATESAQRAIEPWKVLLRGHGMYVWGWDLDRGASRVFRLSRIEGDVEQVGEPGDCDHEPPVGEEPFSGLRCEPLLAVRDGVVVPFVSELVRVGVGPVEGWSLWRGDVHEQHVWLDRVIAHAEDVVVVEPRSLREHIWGALSCAGGGVGA